MMLIYCHFELTEGSLLRWCEQCPNLVDALSELLGR